VLLWQLHRSKVLLKNLDTSNSNELLIQCKLPEKVRRKKTSKLYITAIDRAVLQKSHKQLSNIRNAQGYTKSTNQNIVRAYKKAKREMKFVTWKVEFKNLEGLRCPVRKFSKRHLNVWSQIMSHIVKTRNSRM